jgi:hypothetical protein
MPDYLDYNPSKEKVLADRAAEAEKKQRQRARGSTLVDHGDHGRFTSRGDKS